MDVFRGQKLPPFLYATLGVAFLFALRSAFSSPTAEAVLAVVWLLFDFGDDDYKASVKKF